MEKIVARPSNTLSIKIQRVKTAFFAKKEVESVAKSGETTSYTFKGNNTTDTQKKKKKIAKIIYKKIKPELKSSKQKTNIAQIVAVLTKKTYKKGDCIDIPLVKEKIKFTKLTNANLGDSVYIVIQTEYMPDRKIKMNLKQGGDKKVLTDTQEAIFVTQEGSTEANILFTATVGAFAKKDNVLNATDFTDYAIAKITLESTNEETNKKYKEALNKTEDKKTKLYIAMDAEPAENDWLSVKYEEVFDNRPNLWYYGEGNWFEVTIPTTVYEIYSDNRINKKSFKNTEYGRYIYIDSKNTKHDLGTYKFVNIKNNYGSSYGGKRVNLIDFRDVKNYKKGNVKFGISFSTTRYYVNEDTLASLFGAMLKCGYEDFTCTGFSKENGSPGVSTSHKNGYNGDFRYLRKDKTGGRIRLDYDEKKDSIESWKELDEDRQEKFIEELNNYGWKSFLSQKYGKKKDKKLNKITVDSLGHHYDHLHIQGYNHKFIKNKK